MTEGERPSSPERKIERWDYTTHFREYLLLLARKKEDGLEFSDNFPKKIELNDDWHETMDQIEKETRDGRERLALIGFREDMQHLILPRVFGIGMKTDYQNRVRGGITSEIVRSEIQKVKEKAGVIGMVGDIHSHPELSSKRISFEWFGFRRVTGPGGGFSAGDLYRMVIPKKFLPITAVIDQGERFFAFQTRGGAENPMSSSFPQDAFEKYWYEKYGVQLEEGFAKHIPRGFRHIELNKGIAAKHNLVIYKGKSGEDLVRVYPDYFFLN